MGDLSDSVVEFARARLRQRVGTGECFDLVDRALKNAGARTASDYGTITADADYEWGSEVQLLSAQPGDILQFRNHEIVVKTVITTLEKDARGGWKERTNTKTRTFKRGHHTAIIKTNNGGGVLTVYEQHVKPLGAVVQENRLYITNSSMSAPTKVLTKHTKGGPVNVEVRETTTVSVSGTIWVYRPVAK